MALQMWRKGPDGQQREKKNPLLFKKVYFRKKLLTKSTEAAMYFGYRDGNFS